MTRIALRYLLRATLTTFGVILLLFVLQQITPGDEVERQYQEAIQRLNTPPTALERIEMLTTLQYQLGEDKPLFYIDVRSATSPPALNAWTYRQTYRTAVNLIDDTGVPSLILPLLNSLELLSYKPEVAPIEAALRQMIYYTESWAAFKVQAASITPTLQEITTLDLQKDIKAIDEQRSSWKHLQPVITFVGTDNQFQHRTKKLITGQWGRSSLDQRNVSTKIKEALPWTLAVNGLAILLALFIGIRWGAKSAKPTRIQQVWMAVYTIPNFIVAIWLMTFFTTAEYGAWLDWFPAGGTGLADGNHAWHSVLYHLVLPVVSLAVPATCYIAMQMRQSMIDTAALPMVLGAQVKGLTTDEIRKRHIFPNAISPIFTIVGALPAAVISGSVIVEVLFNLPGMGRLLYTSILANDWAVVYPIVFITTILVVLGYLLSDILLAYHDPRVRYSMNPKRAHL